MKPSPQPRAPRPNRKWQFVLFAAVFALCALSVESLALPKHPREISRRGQISVVSELVLVPVNVTDANGNFVAGLTRDDFHIYEGDRSQTIAVFQQEDSPVSVGLLVDHSGSMGSKLPNVLTAISAFTQASNPQDEMFVVNFGDDVTVALSGGKAFTSDPKEIQNAVSATSAQGRTALYDAVAAGLNHLQTSRWQKKALIIVSDGGDNASRYKFSQILALAHQSRVTIYSIGLVDQSGVEENPGALEQLCKDTGGIASFPRAAAEVVDSSKSVARDLQEQYVLGFEPEQKTNGGAFHKIQVRVVAPAHRGKLRVRTRSGYTTPDANAPLSKLNKDAS